jgi:hypothetical protein
MRAIECFFVSVEQEMEIKMQYTVEIVGDFPAGYIFLTEQCKEDCINPSGQSYRNTQIIDERSQKQIYALHASNRYSQSVLAVRGSKRTIDHLTKSNSDDSGHIGVSVSQQFDGPVPQTMGYSRKIPSSSTAIFH